MENIPSSISQSEAFRMADQIQEIEDLLQTPLRYIKIYLFDNLSNSVTLDSIKNRISEFEANLVRLEQLVAQLLNSDYKFLAEEIEPRVQAYRGYLDQIQRS